MKFAKEILLFLFVLLLTKGYCNDDTVGTHFVTSFLYKNPSNSAKIHLSLYFLPKNEGVTPIAITWWSLLNKKLMTVSINATHKEQNPLVFDYKDVISDGHPATGNVWDVTDPRIYINSTGPVKVLGRVFNLDNNQGDVYLVPPVLFAGKKYLFQLPTSVALTNQLVHILTLPNNNATVQVTITSPNGTILHYQTVNINGAMGSNQKIIPITQVNGSPSVYINSNTNIVVVAAVTCADLNAYNMNNATTTNSCDYAAFMPQQIRTWDCSSNLLVADKRVISGDHTINVGVSPADTTCGSKFPVLSYTNLNSIIGVTNNLQSGQVSNFQVIHTLVSEYATEAKNARISLTRVGSPHANRNSTLDGVYIHYIPETTQFYKGSTHFITFTDGDFLEVYVENLRVSDNMTLNGVNLIKSMINSQTIYSFGNTYSVYKLNANRIGVHTFSCTAEYVAFVISKVNKNTNTAYGYTTGFGISQLISVGGSTTTTTTMAPGSVTTTTTTWSNNTTQGVMTTTQSMTTTTKGSSTTITSSFILASILLKLLFNHF
uniref:IgGFc_binding domain-containing protein n=1 Tax=Strongyloides papillosus TaxID=174720 RepID=A0A0N5BZT1_STREA